MERTHQSLILEALHAEPLTIPQLMAKLKLSKGQVTRTAKTMEGKGFVHRYSKYGPLHFGPAPDGTSVPLLPELPDAVTRETTPRGTTIVRFGDGYKTGRGLTPSYGIRGASTLASIYI